MAAQAGLCLAWSETPEDTFCRAVAHLYLSISNGFVASKIYDKHDAFDFDIVNFPFLDDNVLRSTSYGVLHFSTYSVC